MDVNPRSRAFRFSPIENRLWSRVQKGIDSECWLWTGHCDEYGYGRIQHDGRYQKAHRVAHVLAGGQIPAGLVVMHTCDNPPCCNPAHLRVGTVAENNADRHAKGRSRVPVNPLTNRCKSGHPRAAEHLYVEVSTNQRRCRTCRRLRQQERRAAAKAAH